MLGSEPNPKGTYVLLAQLVRPARIRVGSLATCGFAAGWYAYAGSALGPGGLRARLARHARQSKRLHWHIDYLLQRAALRRIWSAVHPERLECAWAAALRDLAAAKEPLRGFGASDCRCTSHLTYFAQRPSDAQIASALDRRSPAGVRIESQCVALC